MRNLAIMTLLALLWCIAAQKGAAQASIVHDPVNAFNIGKTTAELFNLGQTMQNIKKIQEKAESIKEEIGWLQSAKSVIQLIQIIEETTCIFHELEVNMRIAADLGVGNSCYSNFRYRISINKLLMSIDQVNSVLSTGTKMEPAQRLQILAIVLENFTESQLNFHALNGYYKERIYESRRKKEEDKFKESIIDQLAKHYGG
jgi:hypothetical protein